MQEARMRHVSDTACVDLEAAYRLLLQQCGPCKKYLRTTCDPTYAACRRRLVVAVADAEENMGMGM